NMKQMGLAMHTFLEGNKQFPVSGESIDPASGGTVFATYSFFSALLPYLEQNDVAQKLDLTSCYNETPSNILAAQIPIPTYLCPTTPLRPSSGRDSLGFAYCDY